jgi:flagellar protein FlaG
MTDSVGNVVRSALPVAAARATATGGSRLPANGNQPPPEVAARVAEQTAADLQATVQRMNALMTESRRALRFQVDESSGRTIITVLNPETGEIVRQIPSPEMLALARALDASGTGAMLQERA